MCILHVIALHVNRSKIPVAIIYNMCFRNGENNRESKNDLCGFLVTNGGSITMTGIPVAKVEDMRNKFYIFTLISVQQGRPADILA